MAKYALPVAGLPALIRSRCQIKLLQFKVSPAVVVSLPHCCPRIWRPMLPTPAWSQRPDSEGLCQTGWHKVSQSLWGQCSHRSRAGRAGSLSSAELPRPPPKTLIKHINSVNRC